MGQSWAARLAVMALILAAAGGIIAFFYYQPDWGSPKGFGQGLMGSSSRGGRHQEDKTRQESEELHKSAPMTPRAEVRVEVSPRPRVQPSAPSGQPSSSGR
jgi:hypothetical protein